MFAERRVENVNQFMEGSQLVGDSFSKASKNYKKYSELQDRCSAKLQSSVALKGDVLDLGSGPGTEYQLDNNKVVCVDIALGMLKALQQNFPNYNAINGDAADLPLQDSSIDTIISNLALQWCDDFKKVAAELHRVLREQGEIAISLVAANSLSELSQLGFKTNQFNSVNESKTAFNDAGWQLIECQVRREVVYFSDLKSLIYSIKGVGASAIKPRLSTENKPLLRGKRDWQLMLAKAETMRTDRGLPLTYNIVQIKAKKVK